jgi:hypothetical protein
MAHGEGCDPKSLGPFEIDPHPQRRLHYYWRELVSGFLEFECYPFNRMRLDHAAIQMVFLPPTLVVDQLCVVKSFECKRFHFRLPPYAIRGPLYHETLSAAD